MLEAMIALTLENQCKTPIFQKEILYLPRRGMAGEGSHFSDKHLSKIFKQLGIMI